MAQLNPSLRKHCSGRCNSGRGRRKQTKPKLGQGAQRRYQIPRPFMASADTVAPNPIFVAAVATGIRPAPRSRRSRRKVPRRCRSGANGGRCRWSCSSKSSIFLSARCIAARRLAFSLASDSAQARNSEMKRYSRMSARNVAVPPPMNSGKFPVGQRKFGQALLPLRIERQQPLADRLVERAGQWAVMEHLKVGDTRRRLDALRCQSESARRAA